MSTAANWDALEAMWRSQKPGYKCGWWESHDFFLDKFEQEVQLWNDRKRGEDSTREFPLQVDSVDLNKRIEAAIERANRHTALIPACACDTHQWWWPWIQAFFENLKIQIATRPVPALLIAYTRSALLSHCGADDDEWARCLRCRTGEGVPFRGMEAKHIGGPVHLAF